MITRVEAKQYRCFQSVTQDLGPFHVLVGPNGSGKSVFLDIISFLGDFVSTEADVAVGLRTQNFHDLVFGRQASCFELAIEWKEPGQSSTARYELGVRMDSASDKLVVSKENLLVPSDGPLSRIEIMQREGATAHYHSSREGRPERVLMQATTSALTRFPWDEGEFPECASLTRLLREGARAVVLDNKLLRSPSAPAKGSPRIFDGASLARLVFQLQDQSPERFDWWVAHLQTSLPDLDSVRTVLRPEDKHRYLMLKYKNGVEAPSWVISDGTLRLLALTILAYIPDFKGIYLIEEPENGVHPAALETIYQSLSSVYDGQVLVTSHSPILLNLPKLEELLCFQKTLEGVEITRGDRHPSLQDWKGSVSLGQLFAAGVLG